MPLSAPIKKLSRSFFSKTAEPMAKKNKRNSSKQLTRIKKANNMQRKLCEQTNKAKKADPIMMAIDKTTFSQLVKTSRSATMYQVKLFKTFNYNNKKHSLPPLTLYGSSVD